MVAKPMIRVLHLALVLVIALTAQSFALARGQTLSAAGEVILCIEGQAVTVEVDANGQPTGRAHICPDMALVLMAGYSFNAALAAPVLGRSMTLTSPQVLAGIPAHTLSPLARGPPVSV